MELFISYLNFWSIYSWSLFQFGFLCHEDYKQTFYSSPIIILVKIWYKVTSGTFPHSWSYPCYLFISSYLRIIAASTDTGQWLVVYKIFGFVFCYYHGVDWWLVYVMFVICYVSCRNQPQATCNGRYFQFDCKLNIYGTCWSDKNSSWFFICVLHQVSPPYSFPCVS